MNQDALKAAVQIIARIIPTMDPHYRLALAIEIVEAVENKIFVTKNPGGK